MAKTVECSKTDQTSLTLISAVQHLRYVEMMQAALLRDPDKVVNMVRR